METSMCMAEDKRGHSDLIQPQRCVSLSMCSERSNVLTHFSERARAADISLSCADSN